MRSLPAGRILPADGRGAVMEFQKQTEASVETWHGVRAPNDPARRFAADLENTIRAFEALRGRMRFEDEPSSFEAALQAVREDGT